MDEASARADAPSLRGFRYGWIRGHCRVFNLVSIINIRRGLARGRHLATATARPRIGSDLRVCLFDIPEREVAALLLREHRLRWSLVKYEAGDGTAAAGGEVRATEASCTRVAADASAAAFPSGQEGWAVLFGEYSDAEYFSERCGDNAAEHEERVGQYYRGALYRDDILPVPSYVLRCLRAACQATNADAARDNLLDASFLGDGVTLLRSYLAQVLSAAAAQSAGDNRSDAATSDGWKLEELEELASLLSHNSPQVEQ